MTTMSTNKDIVVSKCNYLNPALNSVQLDKLIWAQL